MTQQTLSFVEYAVVAQDVSSQLASGWSEAAGRFVAAVAAEGGRLVVTETRQFEILAAELAVGFRSAADAADDWAQAARAANHEGAALVYEKYASQYYGKANGLSG